MGKSRLIPTALILATLAGLAWAAVYAYDKGFTRRWRQMIMDELARRGIDAEIEKLTFDPFEGLVARNVRIFEGEDHSSVLATINNITLDIDLARLVRKEQFLNTIDLRDADISFPIDPRQPDGERIGISNFSARIQMPDEVIDIQKAEFEIGGLIVSLRGSLLQPSRSADRPEDEGRPPPDTRQHRQFISDLIGEIKKFHVAAGKPRLEVEVFGDLDKPEEIEAKLKLRASEITRKNYYCDRLEADIEVKFPDVVLDRLLVVDRFGELHGHADYSIGGDRVTFDVESSIDSHTLLRSILDTRAFGEVVFYGPPRLQLQGEYFLGEDPEPGSPPVKLFGNITCGRFISRSEIFEGFHVDFSIDREKFFFRNLLLEHSTGTAEAKLLYSREDGMRYDATVDLSPKIFSLFIDNPVAKDMISRFDFDRSPTFFIHLEGRGPARERTTWRTAGNISASGFRYDGIPVKSVISDFELADEVLSFKNFRLDREEGFISGDLARIDSGRNLVTVKGIAGKIDPVATTRYFSPDVAADLERYRFAEPPTVSLDGDISIEGNAGNRFAVTFSSPGEVRYTFLDQPLPILAPDGKVTVTGTRLELELKAKLFGGDVGLTGNFGVEDGEDDFTSTVTLEGIDFGQLAATYEIKSSSQGSFSGNANIAGQLGSLESIDASGSAIIYDGNVFAIPTLGPLSRLINLMMPRNPQAGYSIASEASAKLQLHGGKLRAEDFRAIAGGFRLEGEGDVDLVADSLDFNVQMNLRGAPGVVLYPVSRLFKYKGEGPIDDPRWRPVNFTLPHGDGPGLLGGPGILPRHFADPQGNTAGRRYRLREDGLPIVRPLRQGITKGVVRGGEMLKSGGERIRETGEKMLGGGKEDEAAVPAEARRPAADAAKPPAR